MSNAEQRYAELIAVMQAGLVKVEPHPSRTCWCYTVAGRSEGTAPTEHLARIAGLHAAMQLITHLLEDQDFYLGELARAMLAQAYDDDGLEPFRRAFRGEQ